MARATSKARAAGNGSGSPTRELDRRDRARARQSDELLEDVFEQGRKEGRAEARRRPRRRRRGAGVFTQEARSAAIPLRKAGRSGVRVIVLTLGVTFLFLLLESADEVGGVMGALVRGIEWLRDPHTVVPANTGGQP